MNPHFASLVMGLAAQANSALDGQRQASELRVPPNDRVVSALASHRCRSIAALQENRALPATSEGSRPMPGSDA